MLWYSQYVPAANVPAVNRNPRHAASRGGWPCHSRNRQAGARIASGHTSAGANAAASSAPSGRASTRPRRAANSTMARIRSAAFGRRQFDVARGRHAQALDATPVRAHDLQLEAADLDRLAAARHAPEFVQHQPADRVELLVREARAEHGV